MTEPKAEDAPPKDLEEKPAYTDETFLWTAEAWIPEEHHNAFRKLFAIQRAQAFAAGQKSEREAVVRFLRANGGQGAGWIERGDHYRHPHFPDEACDERCAFLSRRKEDRGE